MCHLCLFDFPKYLASWKQIFTNYIALVDVTAINIANLCCPFCSFMPLYAMLCLS